MKLYWVSSHDHDHDWFIFAESASAARAYHEQYEGYNQGEARSRLIVSHVTLKEFMNGDPPCNAKFEDLYRIGFEDAGAVKHSGKPGLNGEIFRDGIIEAIIELGRMQLELVPKNSGELDNEASPYTVRPEGPRGVQTGPRLVNRL